MNKGTFLNKKLIKIKVKLTITNQRIVKTKIMDTGESNDYLAPKYQKTKGSSRTSMIRRYGAHKFGPKMTEQMSCSTSP